RGRAPPLYGADRRCDEPRPPTRGAGGALPRGPLSPPRHPPCGAPTSARAARRHPPPRHAVPRPRLRAVRPRTAPLAVRPGCPPPGAVAGERPPAPERHRAGGVPRRRRRHRAATPRARTGADAADAPRTARGVRRGGLPRRPPRPPLRASTRAGEREPERGGPTAGGLRRRREQVPPRAAAFALNLSYGRCNISFTGRTAERALRRMRAGRRVWHPPWKGPFPVQPAPFPPAHAPLHRDCDHRRRHLRREPRLAVEGPAGHPRPPRRLRRAGAGHGGGRPGAALPGAAPARKHRRPRLALPHQPGPPRLRGLPRRAPALRLRPPLAYARRA